MDGERDSDSGERLLVDERGRIIAGVTCANCGYDLRGVESSAHCPECGDRVEFTLYSRPLSACRPESLRRVALGVRLTILGLAAHVVWCVVTALVLTDVYAAASTARLVLQTADLFGVAAAFLIAAGLWLLTAIKLEPRRNRVVRFLTRVGLIGFVAAMGYAHLDGGAIWVTTFRAYAIGLAMLLIALVGAGLLVPELARRLPDHRLAINQSVLFVLFSVLTASAFAQCLYVLRRALSAASFIDVIQIVRIYEFNLVWLAASVGCSMYAILVVAVLGRAARASIAGKSVTRTPSRLRHVPVGRVVDLQRTTFGALLLVAMLAAGPIRQALGIVIAIRSVGLRPYGFESRVGPELFAYSAYASSTTTALLLAAVMILQLPDSRSRPRLLLRCGVFGWAALLAIRFALIHIPVIPRALHSQHVWSGLSVLTAVFLIVLIIGVTSRLMQAARDGGALLIERCFWWIGAGLTLLACIRLLSHLHSWALQLQLLRPITEDDPLYEVLFSAQLIWHGAYGVLSLLGVMALIVLVRAIHRPVR